MLTMRFFPLLSMFSSYTILGMDKSFEEKLRSRFEHSLSAISVRAVERMEVEVEVDNKRRSAEIFEAVIKGDVFRLYVRIVRVNKTFFKEEELYETYELDRLPCPKFTLKKVLSLIKEAGYDVKPSLFYGERENYPLEKTEIRRDEKGRARYLLSLRTFKIDALRLNLSYKAYGEGEVSLSISLKTTELVDVGALRYLNLGSYDYVHEVSKDKKEAIIGYLTMLSSFAMHAGLEIFNIVDYMSIIEVMQERDKRKDFIYSIDKHKSSKLLYDYSGIDRQLDSELLPSHLVYRNNENYYVIARAGDTFDLLSEETGVSARDIRKFNELPKGYVLQAGDVLYLERKRKKAAKKYKDVPHVVVAGESMYTIAQRYGVRLESLYEMNNLPDDYAVQVGDRLRLR